MPHPDEGLIHAWLDGELDAAEAARVEALVASDPEWAVAAMEARGLLAASTLIVGALDRVPANVMPRASSPRRSSAPVDLAGGCGRGLDGRIGGGAGARSAGAARLRGRSSLLSKNGARRPSRRPPRRPARQPSHRLQRSPPRRCPCRLSYRRRRALRPSRRNPGRRLRPRRPNHR